MHPAEEVIAGAGAFFECLLSSVYAILYGVDGFSVKELLSLAKFKTNRVHGFIVLLIICGLLL